MRRRSLSWCVVGAGLLALLGVAAASAAGGGGGGAGGGRGAGLLALLGVAAASAAGPRCVGAAARDPWRSCTRPEHWLGVDPTPAEARLVANQPCAWIVFSGLLYQCGFGVRAEQASATVAL